MVGAGHSNSNGNGNGNGNGHGLEIAPSGVLGQLLALLLSEKAGIGIADSGKAAGVAELETLAQELTKKYAASAAEGASESIGEDVQKRLPVS